MKRHLFNGILIITLLLSVSCKQERKQLDNTFYAFNNCVRTLPNAPEGFEAQAALIKELGYDGMAGHGEQNYFELRDAMDKVGLEMPEVYIGMNITGTQITYHESLKEVLLDSKDRGLTVTLYLKVTDFTGTQEEGDSLFAEGIRALADFAQPLNIQLAIYPHFNYYCETIEHAVKLAEMVNRDNTGVIFNLCHYLRVQGESGWENALMNSLPWLLGVSINGADSGDTQRMDWDQLIKPLGEGSFDTFRVVKLLKDHGYQGKFGLQCFNIKQDCEIALRKSINTWESYKASFQ